MELIKKIKQAEAQAQQIIEQAKADAVTRREKMRENQGKALEDIERERKKAIEAAVAKADAEGLDEVKKLKDEAEKKRKKLHQKANDKMAGAVAKVMEYLRD
jgi:V/A-type H+-transporting ATPase subunit G/H